MRTLTLADIASAPKRSFNASGSALAQDLREWYESGTTPVGFRLGEKEDTERDGSDAQLRDAICTLAGLKRERVPVLDEDGNQKVSEKRGRPMFKDIPFTSAQRVEAMRILGIEERDLGSVGDSRLVGITRVSFDGSSIEDE